MNDEREIMPHYLDDPDWDIAEEGSEGGNWGVLFAHLVLVIIAALGWHYRPLVSEWLGPKPTVLQLCDGTTWRIENVEVDAQMRIIRGKR